MRLDDSTFNKLDDYITAIEREHRVDVVTAWVGGSHSQGLASPESDIDVRFIFVQSLLDYPSLTRRKMSIDMSGADLEDGVSYPSQLSKETEFMGWNALRFLELLADRDDGNNPAAIECLMNELTIRTHPAITEMEQHIRECFNVIELFNHYRGFAKRNWKKYMEDNSEPTVKRMLHILRAVMFARYVRDTHSLPSLHIPTFVDDAPDSVFDGMDREMVVSLIEKKQSGNADEEIDKEEFQPMMDAFINKEFNHRDHIRDETIDAEYLDNTMFRLLRDSTR